MNAMVQHAAQREDGVGKIDVRKRTMGDPGAGTDDPRDVFVPDKIAVGKDGAA